jgi:hypothetical protein
VNLAKADPFVALAKVVADHFIASSSHQVEFCRQARGISPAPTVGMAAPLCQSGLARYRLPEVAFGPRVGSRRFGGLGAQGGYTLVIFVGGLSFDSLQTRQEGL